MASFGLSAAVASPIDHFLSAVHGVPGVVGKKISPVAERDDAGTAAKGESGGITEVIQSIIANNKSDAKEPFYVLDLGVVVGLYENWHRRLEGVRLFYAVKCNPEPALLGAMAALGAGFDCASRTEIETVLALGVLPSRIIYANPCNAESHIRYAAAVGVGVTTFDSAAEVDKLRQWHPGCELLLRIKAPDDNVSRCPLGSKYGALPEEVVPLLRAARAAGLAVTGVSFHVGSGGEKNAQAYRSAIAAARAAFNAAQELGMPSMRVFDIGGGFTAGKQFDGATGVIRSALREYFSDGGDHHPDLEVIAEPGRYFAEKAFTLATNIIGKRVRGDLREYWINDGLYGSLNCIVNFAVVTASPLACATDPGNPTCREKETRPSTVFGQTCDSLDTVLKGHPLPELGVGDWLVFPNMGAYTVAVGSSFNGFATSAVRTHLAYSPPSSSCC